MSRLESRRQCNDTGCRRCLLAWADGDPPTAQNTKRARPCHALGGSLGTVRRSPKTDSAVHLVVMVDDLSVASESALAPGKKSRVLTLAVRDWMHLGVSTEAKQIPRSVRSEPLLLARWTWWWWWWWLLTVAVVYPCPCKNPPFPSHHHSDFSVHPDRRARALVHTTTGPNLQTGVRFLPGRCMLYSCFSLADGSCISSHSRSTLWLRLVSGWSVDELSGRPCCVGRPYRALTGGACTRGGCLLWNSPPGT